MGGHKRCHLPTHLQIQHIAIQINPIHAFQIQAHMPIEHIIHRHCGSHHHSLTASSKLSAADGFASYTRPLMNNS
jgi:hypothetical protein